MNNPYALNTWLDPTVQNYERYFGKTKHPVVWEVGSRDGNDGVELARRIYEGNPDWFWTHADVVCFEPNPEQVKIIKENWPEATVKQVAASNAKGSAPFMVYEGDEGAVGSSSLNLRWKEDDLPGHQITVETDRLENIIGADEKIDIMKIDCEGHSMEVIEGLGDRLKNIRVYHIETEKWTDSNIKVKAFMMGHGFTLVDETEQYGGMPDQVWVRG
jgi:FkbM family methyltransferase